MTKVLLSPIISSSCTFATFLTVTGALFEVLVELTFTVLFVAVVAMRRPSGFAEPTKIRATNPNIQTKTTNAVPESM